MKYNYKIYLASNSLRRIEFLKMLNLEFENFSVDINENQIENEKPKDYIKRIVNLKKDAALKKINSGLVIVADTIVVLENTILQKPKNKKEAISFLELLSDKKHEVLTAFALASKNNKINEYQTVRSDVLFKKLKKTEVNFYLSFDEYKDKAGGYAIQGIGSFMIKEIKGSYSNIVGLPLEELFELLQSKKIIELD